MYGQKKEQRLAFQIVQVETKLRSGICTGYAISKLMVGILHPLKLPVLIFPPLATNLEVSNHPLKALLTKTPTAPFKGIEGFLRASTGIAASPSGAFPDVFRQRP